MSPGRSSRKNAAPGWRRGGRFFKWAVRRRRIVANPCDALPVIKWQPRKVYDLFSEAEITALCGLPVRDGALFQILFDAGARKGDCRSLRFRHWRPDQQVDAPYGLLVFHEGKGGKDRQVPATETTACKLSELAILDGLKPPDHLWYTRPGGGGRSTVTIRSATGRLTAGGNGVSPRWVCATGTRT